MYIFNQLIYDTTDVNITQFTSEYVSTLTERSKTNKTKTILMCIESVLQYITIYANSKTNELSLQILTEITHL